MSMLVPKLGHLGASFRCCSPLLHILLILVSVTKIEVWSFQNYLAVLATLCPTECFCVSQKSSSVCSQQYIFSKKNAVTPSCCSTVYMQWRMNDNWIEDHKIGFFSTAMYSYLKFRSTTLVKLAVTYAKIAECPLGKFHGAKGKLHTLWHFINRKLQILKEQSITFNNHSVRLNHKLLYLHISCTCKKITIRAKFKEI